MRRALFALFLLPAAALAQVTVSDEIVSDPILPHLASPAFAVPAVSMAKDRAGVAIAWSMASANLFEHVYLALFTAAQWRGVVPATDAQPAIASDPNNVTVAWLEGDPARGGRAKAVRFPLSALDSFSVVPELTIGSFGPDAGATRPAVASDGERAIVVWRTQKFPGNHDVVAAIVDGDDKVTPLTIAASAADERDPSVIALDHGAFLVAYEKIDAGERRIAGRFLTFGRQRAVR